MEITESNLGRFRSWILERGRSDGTADLYTCHVRTSAADPKGLTHRLIAGRLAPNTVRSNLAALRAWAAFTKDAELARRLSDLRLPPARRVRHKKSLSVDDWRQAIRHLQTCQMPDAMRQVLLIMALRGLRSGDVLRIRKPDAQRSLDTGKLIYEGKGRKRTEISVEPIRGPIEALVAMRGWVVVRDLLGTSKSPKAMSRKVWRAARRTAAQVGIAEMNPHRYRHTFAQNYLSQLAGDPNAIVKLQRYMGWESMATAARYVQDVSQDELDRIGAGLISGLLAPSG
jgi:integrase